MTDKEEVKEIPKINTDQADSVLEQMKGQFTNVLVIGTKENGQLDILSTINQYPFLHYVLNKAIFEVNLHEKNQQNA